MCVSGLLLYASFVLSENSSNFLVFFSVYNNFNNLKVPQYISLIICNRIMHSGSSFFPFGIDGHGFLQHSLQHLHVQHMIIDALNMNVSMS